MYVCMYVCKYVCMYVCMYVYVYVCMYVCLYLSYVHGKRNLNPTNEKSHLVEIAVTGVVIVEVLIIDHIIIHAMSHHHA